MSFISTGKASRLLSVTPDAILKWIKRGKLPAMKTAGGHYRISEEVISSIMQQTGARTLFPKADAERRLLFCWEFFSENGRTRTNCHDCIVSRAHALKCFEMNHLPPNLGFKGGSCAKSCEGCSYFHYHLGKPFKVLVVTDNPSCKESLSRQETSQNIHFQFVSCEYESSLVIDRFRPDFVLVDCTMQEMKCQELCHHLVEDPRIPETTILLATPPHHSSPSIPGAIRIRNPISLRELEDHLSQVRICRSIKTAGMESES